MKLQLPKLQDNNEETKTFRSSVELPKGWKDVKRVFQYQGLPYVPKLIHSKVISYYHNDLLAKHFSIAKTRELVGQKYYWSSLRKNVKIYIREYNICLTSKTVHHKPYKNLQSWLIPTHQWINLSIDFVTSLPLSTDWKNNNYNSILVIIDQLTKMVHYKLVKVTINTLGLAEVIIDVVLQCHDLSDSIISDWEVIFTSKFWSSFCYFFGIKQRFSTAFYS